MSIPATDRERTDRFQGYRGARPAKEVLDRFGSASGARSRSPTTRAPPSTGVILPRSETAATTCTSWSSSSTATTSASHAERIAAVRETGYRKAVYKIPEKEFPSRPDLPRVVLLGTGGTIASRLDYRTGAVIPAFTPGELYGAVPELADIANLTTAQAVRRLQREHGAGAIQSPGQGDRRGDRPVSTAS